MQLSASRLATLCSFVSALLATGCGPGPAPSDAQRQSNSTVCMPDMTRNRLALVLQEQPHLTESAVTSVLQDFLQAASEDTGLESVGIVKLRQQDEEGLRTLLHELYVEQRVAYVIVVTDPLYPFMASDYELGNLFEAVEGNEDALTGRRDCAEIALSWVIPPQNVDTAEQALFVKRAFARYAAYHRDTDGVASQYLDQALSIYWEPGHPDWGADLSRWETDFPVPTVELYNTQFAEVEHQLRQKPTFLHYNVHGSERNIGLGLNPDQQEGYYSVYTSRQEWAAFAQAIGGAPALFVEAQSCQSVTLADETAAPGEPCCWPQQMIDSGVWAYVSLSGGPSAFASLQRRLGETFFGDAVRRTTIPQVTLFGDVTARFRPGGDQLSATCAGCNVAPSSGNQCLSQMDGGARTYACVARTAQCDYDGGQTFRQCGCDGWQFCLAGDGWSGICDQSGAPFSCQ